MGRVPVVYFVFSLDSGDVNVEPDLTRAAASIDPPDVALAEVFDDTGRRYAASAELFGTVLVDTGEVDRGGLEQRLRSLHERARLEIDETGDFVLSFADAISHWKWDHRWPRWPEWLDRRLHGSERRHYV
jgi:hypothetical protein